MQERNEGPREDCAGGPREGDWRSFNRQNDWTSGMGLVVKMTSEFLIRLSSWVVSPFLREEVEEEGQV